MEFAVIIILLSLLQYTYFAYQVGAKRGEYDVPAPKVSGNETWERYLRVQQNTLEQLVLFVPGMFAFSYYISGVWVLVPGIAYLVGRQLYAASYVKDPSSRTMGFMLTFGANMVVVIGGLIGAGMAVAS